MIGMSFAGFLTLLIISAILSAIVYGSGSILPRREGYFAKLVFGWIGGWLGSPVLGYWGGGPILGSNVHLIPAILGSITFIFLEVALLKALTGFTRREVPFRVEEKRVA